MTARAYIRQLWTRRRAFRACFLGDNGKPTNDGEIALAELKRFCYGGKPTLKVGLRGLDPYASVAAAARQEVWFRIASMLNLDDSDIALLERRAQLEDTADAG